MEKNKKQIENEQKALQMIANVCAVHQGNLQEHQAIQQAMQVLRVAITPAPVDKKAVEKKEQTTEEKAAKAV